MKKKILFEQTYLNIRSDINLLSYDIQIKKI